MELGEYNFDAPQYIDFSRVTTEQDDPNVEKYFDYDHENDVPVRWSTDNEASINADVFATPQTEAGRVTRASKTPAQKQDTQSKSPAVTPAQTDKPKTPGKKVTTPQTVPVSNDDEEKMSPSPRMTRSGKIITPCVTEPKPKVASGKKQPKNLCTNLEEWRNKTKSKDSKSAASDNREPQNKRQHRSLDRAESMVKRQKQTDSTTKAPGPNKTSGLQRSSSFNNIRRSTQPVNKHTRGLSGDRRSGLRSASPAVEKDKHKLDKMTVPTTPTVLKRKPVKLLPDNQMKNSEQMELDKIAFYRQELAKKRKMAQESYKTALHGKAPTAIVHVQEATKTEEFRFETDSRIRSQYAETKHEDVKDFAKMLRSDTGKPTTSGPMKAGHTKPEPFKLTSQRKRKLGDMPEKQAEKYETMAEQLANFNKTPDRFRSRPKGGASADKVRRFRSPNNEVTVPKTPNFETRTRSRPVHAMTRAEQEQMEYEEAKKHQFKAHPVNQRILQNPNTGIHKVPVKPVTVPEEFHLTNNVKSTVEREHKDNEEHYEFHAKPLNKKILEGPVGIKEPKRIPVTQPESPAFALKHRARIPIVEEPKDESKRSLRHRPAAHFGLPFQPQLQHKTTEPQPFTFEERDKKKAELKAKKIEQVYEEEKRNRMFHAQPLPDLDDPHLPPKKTQPLTTHKPFNLDTDIRGAKKAAEWNKKLEEEQQELLAKSRFQARNPDVLEHEPFVPQKENKCTTDFSEFELSTAKRCMKREAFEMVKKAKQDEEDNNRRQVENMKLAEEKAELARLRREAVPKANPIKHYKAVNLKHSEKPPTMPISPQFQTDMRLRTRHQHNESSMRDNVSM